MQLFDMTWPEIDRLNRDTPVVIPIAAVEQHGHHLPLGTDSLLLGEIVRRVAERLDDRVLFLPLQWLGNSHHHLDFPGTLSAPPRPYLDLLVALAENLVTHRFRRLVFLNGHGGNTTPSQQAIFELRQRYRDRTDLLLLASTYWETADPSATRSDLRQRSMGHACEWETSMILRLSRDRVRGSAGPLAPVFAGGSFAPAYRGWITRDRSAAGHIGDPEAASIDKGEHLFASFADGVTRLLEQVVAWDGTTWDRRERTQGDSPTR